MSTPHSSQHSASRSQGRRPISTEARPASGRDATAFARTPPPRPTWLALGFLWVWLHAVAATEPALVPRPASLRVTGEAFQLTEATRVVARGEAAGEAVKLIDALAPALGHRLTLLEGPTPASDVIVLELEAARRETVGEEGYVMIVDARHVELRAATPAGLFYGCQTLRQLLPAEIYRRAPVPGVTWTIPGVEVRDSPRFPWRGLLIDPARHFIPKLDVMRFIDVLAMHKFNRLQIHFTDGQGWRVEIRKYPLLTQLGSRMHNSMEQKGDQAQVYGGYYSQEDVRELVAYAAQRHVMIVPEIEMPYHAGAAIVAYPELGPDPTRLAALLPAHRWAKAGNLLTPRPRTVQFFQDVLDEIVELFPSPHIHIGGDEAEIQEWARLPEMQEWMKTMGFADVHVLHSWFIRQMDAHLTKRGRRLVGWDEILQGGLAEGATVMSWRGIEGGILAAKAGHDVIMTPTSHTYFDYREGPGGPAGLGAAEISLRQAYAFEPVPEALNASEARHILGGQGQLWGELISDEPHREYKAYPRACALIETLWSAKASLDFAEFLTRLASHLSRLDAAGVHYRRLGP